MNVEQELAALITRVEAIERVLFAPVLGAIDAPTAELNAQRQRIEAQTLKQRAEAEAKYSAENPDWDAQIAGATPAGTDGKPGDPDTIGIGPKGG